MQTQSGLGIRELNPAFLPLELHSVRVLADALHVVNERLLTLRPLGNKVRLTLLTMLVVGEISRLFSIAGYAFNLAAHLRRDIPVDAPTAFAPAFTKDQFHRCNLPVDLQEDR